MNSTILNCSSIEECVNHGSMETTKHDALKLFVFLPISFIGFLLNFFTFYTLGQKDFRTPVFFHIRVYTFSSIFINFLGIFNYMLTWNYFGLSRYFVNKFYLCHIYFTLERTLNVFSRIANCLILTGGE